MGELRNEFSRSKSRNEIFQTCPRQYYFNYYGYWGGWGVRPESIRLIEYNLLADQKAEFHVTEATSEN
jgi:hypothetical protein